MADKRRQKLLTALHQISTEERDETNQRDRRNLFPTIQLAPETVLSCLMTEGLMQAFKDSLHRRYANQGPLKRVVVEFNPTFDTQVNAAVAQELTDLIESAFSSSSCCLYQNAHELRICLPRQFPFRMDCCEVFTISDTDPRVQLRGQRGLRAKKFIPRNTVLGIYNGLILPKIVTDHNLVHHPPVGWTGSAKEWEWEVRRYNVEVDFTVLNPETEKTEVMSLDICPCGQVAPGSIINDPRILPDFPIEQHPFLRGTELKFSTDNPAKDLRQVAAPNIDEFLYPYGPDHFLQPGHFPTVKNNY